MARVRDVAPGKLPPELAWSYEQLAGAYGAFRNQVAVFAHVPAALRHPMPLLMKLREVATRSKRPLELAIVAVSQVNAFARHKPLLAIEKVSATGVHRLLDWRGQPPRSARSTGSSSHTLSSRPSGQIACPRRCLRGCAAISRKRGSSSSPCTGFATNLTMFCKSKRDRGRRSRSRLLPRSNRRHNERGTLVWR